MPCFVTGQWSPLNQAGDKKYDRDFLLQFQKLCITRPQSLPNVDCVLSQVRYKGTSYYGLYRFGLK